MRFFLWSVLTAILLPTGIPYVAAEDSVPPRREVTPVLAELNLSPFYKKCILADGFPIVASEKVDDYALLEAAYIVDMMLKDRPDIRGWLVENKVRLSIMAVDEYTLDIPEHSDLTPPEYWNRRARGLGATPVRPAVSCGEENLLRYPGDPYHAENILVHEFAHAMHDMGLRRGDPEFQPRLEKIYHAALEKKLWEGKYAAVNPSEYWAESVQSYFDTNRENDHDHNHVNTREELEEYDPEMFQFVDEVFRGSTWRYVRPEDRAEPGHLAGYDRTKAPRFVWPEKMVRQYEEHQRKEAEKKQAASPHP